MSDIYLYIIVLLGVLTLYLLYRVLLGEKNDTTAVNSSHNIDIYEHKIRSELEEAYSQKLSAIEAKHAVDAERIKLEALNDLKEEEKEMRERIQSLQEKIDYKETLLTEKMDKLSHEKDQVEKIKENLREIKSHLISKQEELSKMEAEQKKEYFSKLEKIAEITKEEAKKTIVDDARREIGQELIDLQSKMLESAEEEASLKAREIVALAVQRCSSEVANEFTVTTVKLPDEDAKGKIIGKGGRNIQWLEKTLGVELVIDETPETMTVSGFNSVRRHIAKRTIELLLDDGRIHPGSIEDMYEKAKAEISQEIADRGQWAVNELGIYDFPAKLVRIIGRLHFRTSYGQNMLKHSVEMAKLARLLAEEMNEKFFTSKPVDIDVCVKGALLHDIGKAIDEETQPKGNHVDLGEKICESFGLDWRIRKCVSSHHDESYYDPEHGFCIEASLVDACDNISGGRIGARKETAEAYFQRVEALENLAKTTPGVTKSWIMRGSRELWVFFDTEKVEASQMYDIVRDITKRIQTEVKYPGEIKVVGLWEEKIVEYAL